MSAASTAFASLPFTADFRRRQLQLAFDELQGNEEKLKELNQRFNLNATAASFQTFVEPFEQSDWLTSSTDLSTFLDHLDSVGLLPWSETRLRWDWTETELRSLGGEIVQRSKRVFDEIAALKQGEHTFDNTVGAYDDNDRIVDHWASTIEFLSNVSASQSIRDCSNQLKKELSEFQVSQQMRVDLFESFDAFAASEEAKATTGESARLIEFTLRDFKRNGLHLPIEQRKRVEEIKKKMSNLGIEFSKNLGEEKSTYDFSKDELGGIPEDQLSRYSKSTSDPSKYSVSLKYPDYFPLMKMCHVAATREKMFQHYSQKCMKENKPILEELINLRGEQAALLGFPTHAAYILDIRMAKSPETVDTFLNDLSRQLTPLMEEELEFWRKIKVDDMKSRGESVPDGEVVIQPYDVLYLTRLSELIKYQVDDEAIKKYFPIEVVTKGLLDIYQQALSLIFEEVKDRPAYAVWHEDAQLFRVLDVDTRKLRGYFYLDMYPRDGKYGHAAVWPLMPGCENNKNGERQLPVCGMVCNFTKPTADQPSLLEHGEVVTFFHEMGHALHGVCSEVKYSRFVGTSVERDFVEAPSQMLENWCYERDPLLMMSGHVDDHSKKLPDDFITSIYNAKKANAGLFNKRQCILGLFDQYIHTHTNVDVTEVWDKLYETHIPAIKQMANTCFAASFGHLAGGYDAQYYGYLWSEVFAADMFESRFLKQGLMNPATGMSYRKEVIGRGGSVDASVMLKNFLGREPNNEAFLRSKGLQV